MNKEDLRTDPRAELVDLITEEMSQIKRTLAEFKTQIEQTKREVDREQQRHTDIATELRQIQDQLDHTPREDIKAKYDEALDSRFRLTTMRGQMEKLQANYEQLENEQKLLSQILGSSGRLGNRGSRWDPGHWPQRRCQYRPHRPGARGRTPAARPANARWPRPVSDQLHLAGRNLPAAL
jgi:hypothetical protein